MSVLEDRRWTLSLERVSDTRITHWDCEALQHSLHRYSTLLRSSNELCRNLLEQSNSCPCSSGLMKNRGEQWEQRSIYSHAGLNLSDFNARSAYLCALLRSFSYRIGIEEQQLAKMSLLTKKYKNDRFVAARTEASCGEWRPLVDQFTCTSKFCFGLFEFFQCRNGLEWTSYDELLEWDVYIPWESCLHVNRQWLFESQGHWPIPDTLNFGLARYTIRIHWRNLRPSCCPRSSPPWQSHAQQNGV